MKKKLIIFIVLLSFVLMPIEAYNRRGRGLQRDTGISFTLSYGYNTSISNISTAYGYNWGNESYTVSESGSIYALAYKNQYSSSLTMDMRLSRNYGLSFSGTYFKQRVDLFSDYSMGISWWDDTTDLLEGEGSEPGDVSIIPLSVNLYYKFGFRSGLVLKLYGGVSMFLVKYNLFTQTGWGDMYEDEQVYAPDWFAIDVEVAGTDQIWGGNVGFDFEQRVGKGLGIVFGGQYYYIPKQTYLWDVSDTMYYEGQMGFLERFEAPDIHDPEEIVAEMDLSFFRFYGGIRIYL